MAKAVRFTREARSDLDGIFRYLAEQNSQAAEMVVDAISNAAAILAEFPQLGRRTDESGVRAIALSRYPYVVYFRRKRDHVQIIRVLHGARRRPGFQEDEAEFVAV